MLQVLIKSIALYNAKKPMNARIDSYLWQLLLVLDLEIHLFHGS